MDLVKPSRCFLCKKKQILLLDCHCKRMFCLTHRMPEDHYCSYDYKENGKSNIDKLNPKITSQKMEMI